MGSYNFPLTTDLKYSLPTGSGGEGTVIKRSDNETTLKNEKYENVFIVVKTYSGKQIYKFFYHEKEIISITDYSCSSQNSFIREINKHKFIVSNGEIIFKSSIKNCPYIRPVSKDKKISNNFLTFDIETRVINNVHYPYLISFYDGTKVWSYYLSDFESIDSMMNTALKSIMREKYNSPLDAVAREEHLSS